MKDEQKHYAQAKVVFQRILAEPAERQAELLAELTVDDPAVRREVESLLAYADSKLPSQFPPLMISAGHSRAAGPTRFARFNKKRRFLRFLFFAMVMLSLIATAYLGRNYVQSTIEYAIAGHLESLVRSNAQAIDFWTESRFSEAQILARDPQVVGLVQRLIDKDQSVESIRQLLDFEIQAMIESTYFEYYVVFNRDRYTVATNFPGGLGRQLNPKEGLRGMLSRVFEGENNINPWRRLGSGYQDPSIVSRDRYFSWFAVPIRTRDGTIIAGISLGLDAEKSIDPTLRFGHWGNTGDTYAFDANGLLVSSSRFETQISGIKSLLRVNETSNKLEIRDPGVDLTAGEKPKRSSGEWPFTRPVMQAIDAASRHAGSPSSEVIMEPYRNYRGVEVIGAWVWLPQQNFGVLSEIESNEALVIARIVDKLFFILISLATIAVLVALGSSLRAGQLRRSARLGQLLGQYKLIRKLADGGAGEVYLAQHEILKRPTAIKLLRQDIDDPESLARFEREVRATSRLTHPNTIEIYDFGRTVDGAVYYAMEYLVGVSLARLIEIEPHLPFGRVVHILRQIASSLREAHTLGLVHRDVKPLNILICRIGGEYDVVKVVDFGLVKSFKTLGFSELANSTEENLLGTPAYIAPEMLQDPKQLSPRVDIYAFGVVAYKMLAACNPFETSNEIALLYDTLHTPPAPIVEHNPDIPPSLSELVMECLEKGPTRRPESMDEILLRLLEIEKTLPSWTQIDARRWWALRDHLFTESL